MVVPGELHEQVAAGEAAREADGAHGRLGAGRHEAEPLDRADALLDELGELGLGRRRRAEREAAARGIRHRLDHARIGVAQDRGTPAGDEVDVLAALDVGDVRALRRDEEARGAADRAERAHRRVHAAGDDGLGAGEQLGVGEGVHAASPWRIHSASSTAQ